MPRIDIDAIPVRIGTGYPEVDMMSSNSEGAFRHKDGTPYR